MSRPGETGPLWSPAAAVSTKRSADFDATRASSLRQRSPFSLYRRRTFLFTSSSIAMSLAVPKWSGHRLLNSSIMPAGSGHCLAHTVAAQLGRYGPKARRAETAVGLAACRDTAQTRDRLFASLIPAAVDAIPESDSAPNYTDENVQRRLRVLAQYLDADAASTPAAHKLHSTKSGSWPEHARAELCKRSSAPSWSRRVPDWRLVLGF